MDTPQLDNGTSVTPINIGVDVRSLTQHDAAEYRRELLHAIHNPGIEFDLVGGQGRSDMEAYWKKVKEVEDYLATFPIKI